MLDRKLIRKDPEKVRRGIELKGVKFDLAAFLALDEKARKLIQQCEQLRRQRNEVSLEVSRRKKEGADINDILGRMRDNAEALRSLESELKEIEEKLETLALEMPNLPHTSVPYGTCPEHNVVRRTWGDIPQLPFAPIPHWEIGEKLGVLDLAAGSLLSGRGFVVLRGDGALLSRALSNFMLDVHRKQGYEEISVPFMVLRDAMIGTGQLPKLADDMYLCEKDELYLIPTAEVPLTNLYREKIIEAEKLPIKLTAFSACFRREAGSYGQETRGLVRVHQFDKVEMVKLSLPESSYEELESLTSDAAIVLEKLEIPYRIIELCTMDLSFAAAKCYDIETFAPGMQRWLEVSSCSNFEDFQARRANIRFRRGKQDRPEFVHTLNGSGLALPRLIATILELNQTPTGKVRIPKALVPYMGGKEYLEA